MALGMPDDKTNRVIAETKARIIYRDIISDNFDPTLEKYKPQASIQAEGIKVVELFEKWLSYKALVLQLYLRGEKVRPLQVMVKASRSLMSSAPD
jgi:integrase